MKLLVLSIVIISLGCFDSQAQTNFMSDSDLSKEVDKVMSDRFKSDVIGAAILVARKGNLIFKKGSWPNYLSVGFQMYVRRKTV